MNKYSLLNLTDSIFEAHIFEILFNELKESRKENPEQFINTVVIFAEKSDEKDINYLFYRIDLTDDERILMFKHLLARSTPENFPAIFSFFQNAILRLAESGERVSSQFLELEDSVRRDALQKIKFSDEEIKWLCSKFLQFIKSNNLNLDDLEKYHLFPSIKWKISAWMMLGLIPFIHQKNPNGR